MRLSRGRAASAIIVLAIGAASLAGCASEFDAAPSPSPAPTEVALSGPCQDLFEGVVVQDGPLAFPAQMSVQVTNRGSEPCELSGFASDVALVNDTHPLTNTYSGPERVDEQARAENVIDVAPGDSAYFWLEITYVLPEQLGAACAQSVRSSDLRLTLPGASEAIFAPAQVELCVDHDPFYRYGPIDAEQRP